jgi:hypothetical protein
MSSPYEYFAEVRNNESIDHPRGLWRKSGDQWEYLSLLDWSWHPTTERIPPPRSEHLTPISPEHAAKLARDRQRWVTYWTLHAPLPKDRADRPLTVVRRRESPERIFDETFGRDNKWIPTQSIREFKDPRASTPPRLKEVDVDTAERIICENRGISGATEL